MSRGFFITGTDTGVGKTVVTAGLLAGLRARGIEAVAMKPVQSGGVMVDRRLVSEDARFYLSLSGISLDPGDINCYCFPAPVSPHLAARRNGEEIEPDVIKETFARLAGRYPMVLVEGAGGLCAPLREDGFTVAGLARELGLPLIVVARAGLGTINHTVLTVNWARHLGLTVRGIIVNGCSVAGPDELEQDNVRMIARMTGAPVLGVLPRIPGLSVEENRPMNLLATMNAAVDWDSIT
ncbi:MAG: dethiobiotin synthase [Firmicutes bacterium]|nr:dethiobiotin synthase [Bacillota bacterium]